MANQEHLDRLKEGIDAWNIWRGQFLNIYPDLRGADLSRADLNEANLSTADLGGADLSRANLNGANLLNANLNGAHLCGAHLSRTNLLNARLFSAYLFGADLSHARLINANLSHAHLLNANIFRADLFGANLSHAHLLNANLSTADLRDADLFEADLSHARLLNANLSHANLSHANLSHANLERTILVETDFTDATLSNSRIYGVSAWNVKLQRTKQNDLIITPDGEAIITVDMLEVAQFVYLLLNNEKIRDVINTLTTKAVLILGRFSPEERKAVLDAIREELRKHNYLPILFDFEKPQSRDITETVTTLARLSRFIIADLTDPRSIPQELDAIVPHLPSVPVQPLLLSSQHEYSMYEHFTRYPWVLPIFHYTDEAHLLQSLKEHVIEPAEQKAEELETR